MQPIFTAARAMQLIIIVSLLSYYGQQCCSESAVRDTVKYMLSVQCSAAEKGILWFITCYALLSTQSSYNQQQSH
jgi:hypothetical protein